jgi:light-independent protochlorophyllide reductase subunit B
MQEILQEQNFNVNFEKYIDIQTRFVSQSTWFSRSIDCQNLTGKEAVVFGDATHVVAITKILVNEMGIKVVWAGSYCKNDKEWVEKEITHLCDNLIFTDDHNLVANLIIKSNPSAIFGTQMERHIGKRLNIPCGVISAPVHIQNFPLSYRPFLGYEGTNQIADLIYNCFTLGMEDHLLEIFGGHEIGNNDIIFNKIDKNSIQWLSEAQEELNKIPNFVRKKIKLNTEKFAKKNNISKITVETMYLAKEKLTIN